MGRFVEKTRARSLTLGATLAAVFAASSAFAECQADLVLEGGHIYTADDAAPTAQAIAVKGSTILAVGSRNEIGRCIGPQTRVIDLHGATLFPGLTDAHAHLLEIGERELSLDLEGVESITRLVEIVRGQVAAKHAGEVIVGSGWIETHWPEARFPTREDLDAVSPGNPVLLTRADGHALVANSAALKLAGVDRNTPAPSGGAILKDDHGEPTGMLVDAAMDLVAKVAPAPTPAYKAEAYHRAFQVYSSWGWTGIHNLDVAYADIPLLEDLDRQGAVRLRVYNAVDHADAKAFLADGPRASADGLVITRAMKFYMDGALGSRGALLFKPYDDAPGVTGLQQMQEADVLPVWEEALRRGVQIATHSIGDKGNHLTLDWYEDAFKAVPAAERKVDPPRWRDEHAQILEPADIPRFAKLGVIASMQPSHAISDLYFAPKRLGETRLAGAYAWKSLIDAGAIVPGGSDAPVERGDPRIEFYAAITRHALNGFQGPDWRPQEAVDRRTALKMFTVWPAYASFREQELGQIKPGYQADFSVFDTDFMTAAPQEILKAHALMTMIGGKTVYRAPGW